MTPELESNGFIEFFAGASPLIPEASGINFRTSQANFWKYVGATAKYSRYLKSKVTNTDSLSFSMPFKVIEAAAKTYGVEPELFYRVMKTGVVAGMQGAAFFSGYLDTEPTRNVQNGEVYLEYAFLEHFGRLSGDVVRDSETGIYPYRRFENVPRQMIVQTLIDEFAARANAAGDVDFTVNYGTVDTLATVTDDKKGFAYISEWLGSMMQLSEGSGNFDIIFRPERDSTEAHVVDIVQTRGREKPITLRYPADGIYKMSAVEATYEQMSDFGSEVIAAGNGEVGSADETTAVIKIASDSSIAAEYGYRVVYTQNSSIVSEARVQQEADTILAQISSQQRTPSLRVVGAPIRWFSANDDGLDVGDSFTFIETLNDGSYDSGIFRILQIDMTWDINGIPAATLTLEREV